MAPDPKGPLLGLFNASIEFVNLGSEIRIGFDGTYASFEGEGADAEDVLVEVRVSQDIAEDAEGLRE